MPRSIFAMIWALALSLSSPATCWAGMSFPGPRPTLIAAGLVTVCALFLAIMGKISGAGLAVCVFSAGVCIVISLFGLHGLAEALPVLGGILVAVYIIVLLVKNRGFSTPFSFPQISFSNPLTAVFSPPAPLTGQVTRTLFHGTPTIQNGLDIAEGAGTWLVGSGNAYGTGVYLAGRTTAKSYAGSNGALVQVQLDVPASQIADHDQVERSDEFSQWKSAHGRDGGGDDLAMYVTEVLGKRVIRVFDDLFVILVDPNLKRRPVAFEGLTVVAVFDLSGNRIR